MNDPKLTTLRSKSKRPSKRNTVISLQVISLVGLLLALIGLYLAFFTDVTTDYGIAGVHDDAMLIAMGFLLSVPSKVALTLWFSDPEARAAGPAKKPEEDEQQ